MAATLGYIDLSMMLLSFIIGAMGAVGNAGTERAACAAGAMGTTGAVGVGSASLLLTCERNENIEVLFSLFSTIALFGCAIGDMLAILVLSVDIADIEEVFEGLEDIGDTFA